MAKESIVYDSTMEGNEQKRIQQAFKKSLEGELIALAAAPHISEMSDHSKTGVANHSKDGHEHSKAMIKAAGYSPATEAQHEEFAQRLIRLRQEFASGK